VTALAAIGADRARELPAAVTHHAHPDTAWAFGFHWNADLPLPHFDSAASGVIDSRTIEVTQASRLGDRQPLAQRERGAIFADGFRFRWNDVVTFDFYAPGTIAYVTGPAWNGTLPDCFYSTVAALVAAWNGLLPLHATALELDGRALLFAGQAGAGKSTLVAELLGRGGRLIGDDLTVLAPGRDVMRGRPAMRLHPDSAAQVDALSVVDVPDDARGKVLVRPRARSAAVSLPLRGIFLIGGAAGPISPMQALQLLPGHLFRPRWSAVLPGHFRRRGWLVELASVVPVHGLLPLVDFDKATRERRIGAVLEGLGSR